MSDLDLVRKRTVDRLRTAGFDKSRATKMAESSVARASERNEQRDRGELRKRKDRR